MRTQEPDPDALRRVDAPAAPPAADERHVPVAGPVAELEAANAALLAELAERHRAEQELREERDRYRQLVEGTGEGFLILDAESRITYLNEHAAEILGAPAAALLDTWFFERVPGEQASALRRLLAGDPPAAKRDEVRLQGSDGACRWVWLRASPLRDESGTPSGAMATLVDVTDRQRLEEQLRQSQKMEAIGQLAGGIAHEFNNVLTVISGYSELMLARLRADDPARSDAEQIRRAAERAASVTQQILAFSRRQIIALRPVELNDLVRGSEPMLKYVMGGQTYLTTRLDAAPRVVLADVGQLTQVLVNLALNARDAMPAGGTLTIGVSHAGTAPEALSAANGKAAAGYARVTVADTGCGIEPDLLPRVFEPFFTTKEPGKGTGLGLSTVDGIVRQLGGQVTVESRTGSGTRFDIYLPLVAPAEEESRDRTPAAAGAAGTILVVEDDNMVRALAREALEASGYAVLEAPHGAEALRLCQVHSGPLDLLLTDLVMPGMTGREVGEAVARLRPEARTLYMSGHGEDDHRERGALAAGAPFLRKPFTPQRLVDAVQDVLARPRGDTAPLPGDARTRASES